jgi:hypothetical protein
LVQRLLRLGGDCQGNSIHGVALTCCGYHHFLKDIIFIEGSGAGLCCEDWLDQHAEGGR